MPLNQDTHTLNIKNMVCGRCIRVVKEELEKLGLDVRSVRLGEAVVSGDFDNDRIKETLRNSGFDLIEDRKIKIIEKIKNIIINLIRNNSSKDLDINFSESISKEVGLDYHYLSTIFSAQEGITIEKYIIYQKIEYVKELLKYEELTLNEIAYQLGYSSVQHLSNQFKKVTGMSASQYKQLKNPQRTPLDQI